MVSVGVMGMPLWSTASWVSEDTARLAGCGLGKQESANNS